MSPTSSLIGVGALTLSLSALAIAPATADTTRRLAATAKLERTARPGPNRTVQRGPIRGIPFGRGNMVISSTLRGGFVYSRFSIGTTRGAVAGRSRARLTLDGDTATYRGTATLRSGTRRYRGIRGLGISFTGTGPVSAKRTTVRLRGRVRY